MLRSAGPDGGVSSVWIRGGAPDALHESGHDEPVSWQRFGTVLLQQPRSNRDAARLVDGFGRSEEHTSELQSLMRISYAVFCLQKKKQRIQYYTTIIRHTHTNYIHK